jgi:hypothetical protein
MSELPQIKLGRRTFTVLFPDLLRPLTPVERDGLKASIRALGVRDRIHVDENDGLIDGANRLEIAVEEGLTEVPIEVHRGLTHQQKRALAEDLNVQRRQLSPEDRQRMRAERIERVAEKRQQGMSQRAIAEEEGISQKQVRRDLEEATESGDSVEPKGGKVTGLDGRQRAAHPQPADDDDDEQDEQEDSKETKEWRERFFFLGSLEQFLDWLGETTSSRSDERLAWYTSPDAPGPKTSLTRVQMDGAIAHLVRIRDRCFPGPAAGGTKKPRRPAAKGE